MFLVAAAFKILPKDVHCIRKDVYMGVVGRAHTYDDEIMNGKCLYVLVAILP
jgi:hypothetical protein